MAKIINIFGGAGVGKSTFAAELFVNMKKRGISVEMPYEYPKELTWEKNSSALSDQLLILANQHRSITRLYNSVDYIIMDSPLLLSIIYKQAYSIEYPANLYDFKFDEFVLHLHESYLNTNIILERNLSEYDKIGRNQTLEESIEIDNEIERLFKYYRIDNIKINPRHINIDDFIDSNIL
jgi:hypothetical protein